MHDLVAAQDIVKVATKIAQKNKLKSISRIVVRLGQIVEHGDAITPENLRFNFALVKRNTLAEKAKLVIRNGKGTELSIAEVGGSR
ncbi:MAG: hydrogenase maturation nickel metallochaperone HypA [Patescibacteria group bacterium]